MNPEVERNAVISSRISYIFDCSDEVAACPYCDETYCEKHKEMLTERIRCAIGGKNEQQ